MRKFIGGILGLLSVLFLGLAYSQMAEAGVECSSAIAKKLGELSEGEAKKVLSLQLQLTVAKLSVATIKSKSRTVEAYIRKQEGMIDRLNEQTDRADGKDDGNGAIDRLLLLYRESGESTADMERAIGHLETTLNKIAVADYRSTQTRFKNSELAVFARAHSLVYGKESPFSEVDSAILWMRSELSDGVEGATRRGSASANLLEASSWVVRSTGIIGPALTAEELEAQMATVRKQLDAEFSSLATKYRGELAKACSLAATCTDCAISKEDQDQALIQVAAAMKKRLATDGKYREAEIGARVRKEDRTKSVVAQAKKKKVEPVLDLAEELKDAKTATAATASTVMPPTTEKTEAAKSTPTTTAATTATATATETGEKNPYDLGDEVVAPSDPATLAAQETEAEKAKTRSIEIERKAASIPENQHEAAALHLEKLSELPLDQERRGNPAKYGPCDVSPMITRKKSADGKSVEVYVKFVAKHAKTGKKASGEYHFPEPIDGLVKDVWFPTFARNPEVEKVCPPEKT